MEKILQTTKHVTFAKKHESLIETETGFREISSRENQ
jgi:hypothetical protein